MSQLSELYQHILVEHNRSPVRYGALKGATNKANGHNPLCGDELAIELVLENDVVSDARFNGDSCAISMASASILMKNLVGKSRSEAESLIDAFTESISGEPHNFNDEELTALMGVKQFPARIKCALLPWKTAEAALRSDAIHETNSPIEVTTE